MNGSRASEPFEQRRAFVRALGRLIRSVARRRRKGWLDARGFVQGRCGLDLRGWPDLSAGRVERVPGVALERLRGVMAGTGEVRG